MPAAEPLSGTSIYIVDKPGGPQSIVVAGNVTAAAATKAGSDRVDPDDLLIVVVGDRERIEPGLRELGLGDVKTFDMSVLQ